MEKNRTFEEYCTDNAQEDVYGTRYVLDVDNEIVSSLIILKLKDIVGKKAYGIGSVLTPKIHAGKGYTVEVLLITSDIENKGFLTNVIIEKGTTLLKIESHVVCAQPYPVRKTLFEENNVWCAGRLSPEKMDEVDEAIYIGLCMDQQNME